MQPLSKPSPRGMPILTGRESTLSHSLQARPRLLEDMPTFFGAPRAISPTDLNRADIGAHDVDESDWFAASKSVRQQFIRYRSSYIQGFNLDVLANMRVAGHGDAAIPERASR
jgi:hypothetical protein